MKNLYASFYGIAALLVSSAAMAQETGITLPTADKFAGADVKTLVGLVLGGLAVIWGARKLIKTTNRS